MKRILVVEPNGAIAEALATSLFEGGYAVTLASRAAEAREILSKGDADLLVTNAALPNGSAIELAYFAHSQGVRCLMYGSDPLRMAALLKPWHGIYMVEPLDGSTVREHVATLLAPVPLP
jgi:DNA-binding NtrC family response regulator